MNQFINIVRRNRTPLIIFNYSISLVILIYLLVIGYETSSKELDYSHERAEAERNGASEEELQKMNAEQHEEMEPYAYKFKVVASILIPILVFTCCLYQLGPVKQTVPVFAHSELVPIPVAKLIDIEESNPGA
jgi:hypothetical protein